ncbi:MAG: pantetheine-phosphate adenylyltransferase [Propionibacteriaceae bacterium]|jgi:pantetheine-phosphate adenylyltransferase|nr:pantetheine-phosphate adenylyltransferase [Propionibacteriaceae bacterium]
MMKAVVAGSFDPITNGHVDLVERARELFRNVVVGVGVNDTKTYLFDSPTRLRLVRETCSGQDGVTVEPFDGLLVDFCREHDVSVIVRGARNGSDFDLEVAMAQMNRSLTGIETVILPVDPRNAFISSTLIRQIARAGGSVAEYVPGAVVNELSKEIHHG